MRIDVEGIQQRKRVERLIWTTSVGLPSTIGEDHRLGQFDTFVEKTLQNWMLIVVLCAATKLLVVTGSVRPLGLHEERVKTGHVHVG